MIPSSLGRDMRLVFSESTTHTHEMKLILDEQILLLNHKFEPQHFRTTIEATEVK